MYGVVLWSDSDQDHAVIWCEDHGDLAFYTGDGASALEGDSIDPGDLVQFEISEGREMRRASRPRLVAEHSHPTLARDLKRAVGDNAPGPHDEPPARAPAARPHLQVV